MGKIISLPGEAQRVARIAAEDAARLVKLFDHRLWGVKVADFKDPDSRRDALLALSILIAQDTARIAERIDTVEVDLESGMQAFDKTGEVAPGWPKFAVGDLASMPHFRQFDPSSAQCHYQTAMNWWLLGERLRGIPQAYTYAMSLEFFLNASRACLSDRLIQAYEGRTRKLGLGGWILRGLGFGG